jgi:hypothetical protein
MTQPKIQAQQLGTASFTVQLVLEAGADNTYTFIQSARFPFTIDAAYFQTDTGTITANVRINATSVTGLGALSLTSTPDDAMASALNSVAVGDKVNVVFSANAAATFVSLMLECTRT